MGYWLTSGNEYYEGDRISSSEIALEIDIGSLK
jgi:hypothetical protein